MSFILGISAFYHDSAACLIESGRIVAAAQEERFTRVKHDARFPHQAIKYCLSEAGISPGEVEHIVFYEKPFLKFERLLETYLSFAPKGFKSFFFAMPRWIKEKLYQKNNILNELRTCLGSAIDWKTRLRFSEHHISHASSAFYPSPFESAAVLTMDGVGEWTTSSVSLGNGKKLRVLKEIYFPHSLGLLYSAFTYYLGFKVNSGEYKVMGLAPYGRPVYAELIKRHLINVAPDGSFQLDMSYFDYPVGLTMTNKKFEALFGGPPRMPEAPLAQKDMDIAASVQKVTEDVVIRIARDIAAETKEKNLCLAGGVALNCVVNGILAQKKIFDNIWVQPAAGDAGGALGAALAVWHLELKGARSVTPNQDGMSGAYLGPEFGDSEILQQLEEVGAKYRKFSDDEFIEYVASLIADDKCVGWMQGRMEFGPRALGARSIIADPRSETMQKQLNLKIKYRESFRPFAPSVLSECAKDWFELDGSSPYMSFVCAIRPDKRKKISLEESELNGIDKLDVVRSVVPAVTHIDYSARVQTVHTATNQRYHALIQRFKERTGCPLVVNTSFNVRGEPIVCTPKDAFNCFMGTEMDVLAIGNYVLLKVEQDSDLSVNYEKLYQLD